MSYVYICCLKVTWFLESLRERWCDSLENLGVLLGCSTAAPPIPCFKGPSHG